MQKSSVLSLSTTPVAIVSNSVAGEVIKVLTLVVTNASASSANVDVEVRRFGDTFKIMKESSLSAGKSVSVFIDKDFGIFLENGDELRLYADTAGVEAVCSYETAEDMGEPRPAPTSRVVRSQGAFEDVPEEDLTVCPGGPCLGANWFCCPDNIYCTPTEMDCPSGDLVSATVTVSGVPILLSDYFEHGAAVRRYDGVRGSEMLVPEGFNYAVFVDSSGQVYERGVSPGEILVFRSTILAGTKKRSTLVGCCHTYEGNFYSTTYENCTESNAEFIAEFGEGNKWFSNECPAEGTQEHEILSNLAEFRGYSLDKDLIDLFFNQGVNAAVKDLDEDSTVGGNEFSLTVNLSRRARNPFGDEFLVPEDVQIYIYAESFGGAEAQGMISASKIIGENKILVTLDHDPRPNGVTEFSFQMNLEHEDFATLRTTFLFRNDVAYEHSAALSGRVFNMPGRLNQTYMDYLHSWISDFWAAYDAGESVIAPLTRPESNANTEFYPFAHALWYLRQSNTSAQTTAPEPFVLGNRDLVEPWNFLGVDPEIYKCIMKARLYSSPENVTIEESLFPSEGGPVDNGFDCRSFSLAAIRFLKQQLSAACPGTRVSMQIIEVNSTESHAIVRLDLPGEPAPCCEGSFLYEPQSGETFIDMDDYCRDHECSENPNLGNYDEDGSPTLGNPNWENDPAEVDRITGVICGCLADSAAIGSSYPAGSAEALLLEKCDDGTFGDWFKDQFSWDPGDENPPPYDFPQILSCERVSCFDPAENDGQKCVSADPPSGGVEPYVCEMNCKSSWDCGLKYNPVSDSYDRQCYEHFKITEGYKTQEECEALCTNGSWCKIVSESNDEGQTIFLKTGECVEGTKAEWKEADDLDSAGDFRQGSECNESDCPCERKCHQLFVAHWDCENKSWNRGLASFDTKSCYLSCQEGDDENNGMWKKEGLFGRRCVYVYRVATDAPCCPSCSEEFDVPNGDPSEPPLPSFIPVTCERVGSYYDGTAILEPSGCCCTCPPVCQWLWEDNSWRSVSGGIGVLQSQCESGIDPMNPGFGGSGCGCEEPNYAGTFRYELGLTKCFRP